MSLTNINRGIKKNEADFKNITGLAGLAKLEEKKQEAISNPAALSKKRADAIDEIGNDAAKLYESTYNGLFDEGVKADKAEGIAYNTAQTYIKSRLAMLNALYPEDINAYATGIQINAANALSLSSGKPALFRTPNVQVGATRTRRTGRPVGSKNKTRKSKK
jgi:hypothetical protein